MITLVLDDGSFCWLVLHTVDNVSFGDLEKAEKKDHTDSTTFAVGTRSAFIATDFSVLAGIALETVNIRPICNLVMYNLLHLSAATPCDLSCPDPRQQSVTQSHGQLVIEMSTTLWKRTPEMLVNSSAVSVQD